MLIALYAFILVFTYVLQNLAFKRQVSETATSIIMWIVGSTYLLGTIVIVLKFEIPLVATGVLNLCTVGLLLKISSYAHVLNNVRYYIRTLDSASSELRDDAISEMSRTVS